MRSDKFLTGGDYGKVLKVGAVTTGRIKYFIPRETGTRISVLRDQDDTDILATLGLDSTTDLVPGVDIFKAPSNRLIKKITISVGSVWAANDETNATY